MKAQPLLPAVLKRLRAPRVAVLALVLCSLLVPLAFLFDRAPSGRYPTLSSLARSLPRNAHWVGSAARITASPPVDLAVQLPPVVGRPPGYRAAVLINLRLSTFRDCFRFGVLYDGCARCRVRDDGGAAPTGTLLACCFKPSLLPVVVVDAD